MDKIGSYRKFLESYISLLEKLVNKIENMSDPKFIAQLRTAERSFNFLLDEVSAETEYKAFSVQEMQALKQRRDNIADKVSRIIEKSDEAIKRYEGYCDNLKDTRKLSSLL